MHLRQSEQNNTMMRSKGAAAKHGVVHSEQQAKWVPWDMSKSTLAATDCSARLPWCSNASKGFRPLSCRSPALAAGCCATSRPTAAAAAATSGGLPWFASLYLPPAINLTTLLSLCNAMPCQRCSSPLMCKSHQHMWVMTKAKCSSPACRQLHPLCI